MGKLTKLHLLVGIPAFGVLLLIGLGANFASAEPIGTVPMGTLPTDTSTLPITVPVTTDTLPTTILTTDPTTATSSSPPTTSTPPASTATATSSSTAPTTAPTTARTTAPSTTSNPTTQRTTGSTSSPQSPIPTQITITGPNGGVQTIAQDPSAPLPAQGLFLGAAVGGADKSGQRTTAAASDDAAGSIEVPLSSSDLVNPASLETETIASGPGPTRILIVTLLAVAALTGLIYGYTRWYDAHR